MKKTLLYFTAILFLYSCSPATKSFSNKDDGRIQVNFIQVNDVYEIAPLSNGNEGGMARIASIKQKYVERNPNSFLVMAGDFLSPSVYNSLKYQGKSIRGKQMVEAMNAAGFDFVIFGNHEFDIKEAELQERINESQFQWISSNSFHKKNDKSLPFEKVNSTGSVPFPVSFIKTVKDEDGTVAKIGFIGLTLPFNKASYVSYTDVFATAKDLYNKLKDSVDAVIAITHQSMEEDEELAREIPGLAAIMGGHEHDQRYAKINGVPITKAMANAKNAFVVRLSINKNNRKTRVFTKLETLDETIVLDNATNSVVQKWVGIAEANYGSLGFEAGKVVLTESAPLDGRESEIRNHPTNLTRLIVKAMANAAPNADVVIMNAGSIRVDDVLQMPVTQYDIIRTLPFGGSIREIEMKGSLLTKILEQGVRNKGIGGYLHVNENISFNAAANTWKIGDTPVDILKTYRVALPDFLFTGGESNLEYLKPGNPDVVKVLADPSGDIRLAIIKYLGKK